MSDWTAVVATTATLDEAVGPIHRGMDGDVPQPHMGLILEHVGTWWRYVDPEQDTEGWQAIGVLPWAGVWNQEWYRQVWRARAGQIDGLFSCFFQSLDWVRLPFASAARWFGYPGTLMPWLTLSTAATAQGALGARTATEWLYGDRTAFPGLDTVDEDTSRDDGVILAGPDGWSGSLALPRDRDAYFVLDVDWAVAFGAQVDVSLGERNVGLNAAGPDPLAHVTEESDHGFKTQEDGTVAVFGRTPDRVTR